MLEVPQMLTSAISVQPKWHNWSLTYLPCKTWLLFENSTIFIILHSRSTSQVIFGPNMAPIEKFSVRMKVFKWSAESIFMV